MVFSLLNQIGDELSARAICHPSAAALLLYGSDFDQGYQTAQSAGGGGAWCLTHCIQQSIRFQVIFHVGLINVDVNQLQDDC